MDLIGVRRASNAVNINSEVNVMICHMPAFFIVPHKMLKTGSNLSDIKS